MFRRLTEQNDHAIYSDRQRVIKVFHQIFSNTFPHFSCYHSFWIITQNCESRMSIGNFFSSYFLYLCFLASEPLPDVTNSRHLAYMVLPNALGSFKDFKDLTSLFYKRTIDGVSTLLYIMPFIERIHFILLK